MEVMYGFLLYGISLLTMGSIYGILCLGLNLHWGVTGIFNAGVGGFVAVGGYASAILTTSPSLYHLGGFDLPLWFGALVGMVLSGLIAWLVASLCIRLRSDYLAIATLGIAEMLRLIFKNEGWATNGPRGIGQIPRPFEGYGELLSPFLLMVFFLLVLSVCYYVLERLRLAPWGRVMSAIRDNEEASSALGKDVERFRTEAFVVGAMLMGLGGSLLVHYLTFMGPRVTEPVSATFLVWVMVIVGGSGSYKGSILGALAVWTVWSVSEIIALRLPEDWALKSAYLRIFFIGFMLQVMLQKFPRGLWGEKRLMVDDRKEGV
jgi:branched-chain amino acid transport system permease protein